MNRSPTSSQAFVALALSGTLAVLSWRGATDLLGEGRPDGPLILVVLRTLAPLAIALLLGTATFYLLVSREPGQRPSRRTLRNLVNLPRRRPTRVAESPNRPPATPLRLAGRTLLMVFWAAVVWLGALFAVLRVDEVAEWRNLLAILVVAFAVVVGFPLALIVGIVAAVIRAFSRRKPSST